MIETIVAFAILSLFAGVLYRGLAGHLSTLRDVRVERAALELGKSALTAAGLENKLRDGWETHGETDVFHWSVSAAPYRGAEAGTAAYWVTVEVTWQGARPDIRRAIRLKTLKVAESAR